MTYLGKVGWFASLTYRHKGNLIKNAVPQTPFHEYYLIQMIQNGRLVTKQIYKGDYLNEKYYRGSSESSMNRISASQFESGLKTLFPSASSRTYDAGAASAGTSGCSYRITTANIRKVLSSPSSVSVW